MPERMGPEPEVAKARVVALRLLARRARARADLAERLRRKGFPSRAIQQALDGLAREGYLDDLEFAHDRIDELLRKSKQGSRGLIELLVKDGLDPELAERVVAERLAEVDQRAWAREVAAQRLRTMPELEAAAARRRLYSYLRRRGFDNQDIVMAIEEVLPGE